MVIFFGMTNSPAMFQGMMNEIIKDFINKGKVAVFVDDVLVGCSELKLGLTLSAHSLLELTKRTR